LITYLKFFKKDKLFAMFWTNQLGNIHSLIFFKKIKHVSSKGKNFTNTVRVCLSLRFQKVRFKNVRFKKIIFKNAVKRLTKSQFGL
jgi:hypothetical protein